MNLLKSVRHQIEEYETQVRPLVRQRLFLFKMVKHHTIEILILRTIPISNVSKIFLFDSESKLFS